jgi:hypothetical protein
MKKETKDIFMYTLAGLVITYAFAFLFMLFFKEIPDKNRDIITTLSGILVGGGFATVLGYFFQTNKSSADKTEIIAKSLPVNSNTTVN